MPLKSGVNVNCKSDYMTLRNFMVIISVPVKSSVLVAGSGIMWHYHDVSYEKQHYVCTSSIHNEHIPVTEKFCSYLFLYCIVLYCIYCAFIGSIQG